MLQSSDTDIKPILSLFRRFGVGVALIVPTETGLKKSIIDATENVRSHFRDTDFHDYISQAQGVSAKVLKDAYLIDGAELLKTKISLYRPTTKSGDPRLWVYGLNKYAKPRNLIAIFATRREAFVINCSKVSNRSELADSNSKVAEILSRNVLYETNASDHLLEMIKMVSQKGFITSLREGPTGVGMTLETHLGISANSSREPDYRGIEIKAKRLGGKSKTRSTLFSQVPNWELSPIGSAWNLLSTYGYHRNGRLRLNHQIDATKPNSLGFVLQVDSKLGWLKQNYFEKSSGKEKHIATWLMSRLHDRLEKKHPETFWVGADCKRDSNGKEQFHYVEINHTKKPMLSNFDILLEAGVISVDYLMSERSNGVVRDHGYLFKMHQEDFNLLFPPPAFYDLRSVD